MEAKTSYKRLPGGRLFIFGFSRASAWLGPDHLLYVTTSGYTEEYKRFYYRDIQAIVMRKTKMAMVWTAILSGIWLLVLGGFLFLWRIWNFGDALILSLFFCFPVLALLLLHIIRGAMCKCTIQTAVQTEQLSSFTRVRASRKAIHLIKERIDQAQGQLPDDMIQAVIPEAIHEA
jgi:hypothetical protein